MPDPRDDDARSDGSLNDAGDALEPEVVEFLDLLRAQRRDPAVGPELQSFVGSVPAEPFVARGWARLRRTPVVVGSAAAATGFVVSGLGLAHALPARAQDFVSRLHIG